MRHAIVSGVAGLGQERALRRPGRGLDGSTRYRLLLLGAAGPLAAGVLQGASAAGFEVVEAWTGLPPDHPVRRADRRLRFVTPRWSVASLLARQHAPIRQVPRLAGWTGAADAARASGAHILVSAGFMQRVPKGLLDAFPGRVFNLHPALLPRRRGPQPVLASLLEGTIDLDGGMTLHVMDEAFDAGDVVAQVPVRFDRQRPQAYAFALATAAARLVARDLPRHLAGERPAVPQAAALATPARVDPGALVIGAQSTLAEADRLLAGFGALGVLRVAGALPVRGAPRRLGPPTGAPSRVGPFAVDLDLADARVRLTRRRRSHRWAARIQGVIAGIVAARADAVI
jgi:methionyl-tRNA formyltransferase